MLLVHNNQARAQTGRKNGRAGSQNHVGQPLPCSPPAPVPGLPTKTRVQNNQLAGEALAKSRHQLRRQCDFGYQDQNLRVPSDGFSRNV